MGKVLQIFWDRRELGNFKASFTASSPPPSSSSSSSELSVF